MSTLDTIRLTAFPIIWTAVWVLPLPRLKVKTELLAGLIPFAAFGLRVFAGFFVDVPDEDAVRVAVSPLLDWINGEIRFLPYLWVLDATIALGLIWLASAFDIPRRTRIATAWIMPTVALFGVASLQISRLPLERFLAARIPSLVLACATGGIIGGVMYWTPSPIPEALRRRAAVVSILSIPAFVAMASGALQLVSDWLPEHASQAESVVALATGTSAALAALCFGGFDRPRSRFLFSMTLGVAAGAVVALYARPVAFPC